MTTKVCPHCGQPVGEDDVFCPSCGKQIVKSTRCPVCGNEMNGAAFCSKCGYSAKSKTSVAMGNFGKSVSKGAKKAWDFIKAHKKWAIIVAAIIAVIIIVVPTAVVLSSPFRQAKVSKVELGVTSKEDIRKMLGEPTEELSSGAAMSGMGTMTWVSAMSFTGDCKSMWVYYESSVAKKLEAIEKKAEKAEDFDDLEKLYKDLEKATKNPFKSIVVAFDGDDKVTFIALNTDTKYDDDIFASAEVKSLKSIELIQNQVCIGSSVKESKVAYVAKFKDKSMIKSYVTYLDNTLDTSEEGSAKITFSNDWANYSGNVKIVDHSLDDVCVCKVCGKTFHQLSTDCKCTVCGTQLQHNYYNCVCTNCGNVEHTLNANCVCTVCHKTLHEFSNWRTSESPTCTEAGSEYRTCSNCNKKETQAVEALGHTGDNGVCIRCTIIFDRDKFEETFPSKVYQREGSAIYFGTYPQTKVTDSALTSALSSLAGTKPTSSNSYTWTSYGYYISGSVSNYMWYIDKEYNGEKYRGVYFTSYRPYYSTYSSSASNSYQDDNGYYTSTIYWFKYEPIKWSILTESDGKAMILADLALDSQQYYHSDYSGTQTRNGKSVYANNYAESEIRAWLNDTFYNTAFTSLQKELIQTTNVDNSAASAGYSSNSYACENTNDKIFLLSYKEETTYLTSSTLRQKKSTDYAKSQGCWQSTSSSYAGNCYRWLRSPDSDGSRHARGVDYAGGVYSSLYVYFTDYGVLPALVIRLS